jgi:hypothetical protein
LNRELFPEDGTKYSGAEIPHNSFSPLPLPDYTILSACISYPGNQTCTQTQVMEGTGYFFNLTITIYYIMTLNPQGTSSKKTSPSPENERLNLQPGDWVEIRSMDEISKTLDENGKYQGLFFMPEMENFCGKKFRIFKRAEIIKLESTGEVRKLKSPTVLLEGVYCDGEHHEGCDRACFHFWRETWLKRTPGT